MVREREAEGAPLRVHHVASFIVLHAIMISKSRATSQAYDIT